MEWNHELDDVYEAMGFKNKEEANEISSKLVKDIFQNRKFNKLSKVVKKMKDVVLHEEKALRLICFVAYCYHQEMMEKHNFASHFEQVVEVLEKIKEDEDEDETLENFNPEAFLKGLLKDRDEPKRDFL